MEKTAVKPQSWWPQAAQDWPEEDRERLSQLDPARLPAHVAVIMDGNGRWARQRGYMDRIRGHEAGIDSVRTTTRTSAELGLKVLTLYAFSKENWVRPRPEISALMKLLERFLVAERGELMRNNIRLKMIGVRDDLPEGPRRRLEETIELTSGNTGMILNLALSYGSRNELVRAVQCIAAEARQGELDPAQIDEEKLGAYLDTAGLADPDLMIRTSGEMRISNFLLWQMAYAEFYITPVLWPDFRRTQLLDALLDFQRRERRFGGLIDSKPKS